MSDSLALKSAIIGTIGVSLILVGGYVYAMAITTPVR